jgi:putative ABC transport system permease protein
MSTLARASRRDMRQHLSQTLLTVLGVALGVAVLVAVELANESARRAFDLSMSTLTGKATHRLVAGETGLEEGLYAKLRARGVRPSTPIVEGLVGIDGETFRLIGIDPFSDGDFRPASANLPEGDLNALLTRPGTVLLGGRDLRRLALRIGDELELEIAGAIRPVEIVGRLESDNPVALEGLIFADIATVQELLERVGKIDRIELILEDDRERGLEQLLPDGVRLEAISGNRGIQQRMTESFHTNLAAMGLLALLVGVLLVYNTVTFSVLRRRGLLGMLRVLGVTRGDLFHLVLRETLLLGLIGTLLGLLLGTLLGQGLVRLVTRTINDLYFVLTVSSLLISPAVLLKGFLIGVLASAAAAIGPAIEAARTIPQAATRRSGIERQAHLLTPWLALAGVSLIGFGLLGVALPHQGLAVAFVALFLCVIGYALLVPGALLLLTRLVAPLSGRLFGNTGRLATRGIAAGLSRSGIAVAALAVAVSATVGVGIMVESFRETVRLWLHQTLSSDVYVSLAGSSRDRLRHSLSPELLSALERIDGVASMSTGRARQVDSQHGPVRLLALGDAPHVETGFRFKRSEDAPFVSFRRGETLFVSEALAYHQNLALGDAMVLTSPGGPQRFRVGAIYFDYSTDRGMISIDRASYARLWRDPGVTTVGLRLAADADLQAVTRKVRALAARSERPALVRANAEIRALSMQVFDRTFAITGVLRLLAVGVAFIGVLSALLALQLERSREQATLRALGVTPRQLTGLVSLECGLMGLTAGLLALPLGWLMGQLLIHVLNQRSFGWSMQSLLPPGVLGEAVILATVAALLAGLYPAWRLASAPPADALREE